jgi:3-oxoacyl-[acyl-carrier protein] reductase
VTDGAFIGRVALVTGGGRGIGAATCRALAHMGAFVYVNYDRSASAASEVVEAIHAGGGTAVAIEASVADPLAVRTMFARIRAESGRLDLLVNNAGTIRDKLLGMMSNADWQHVIDVNLNGVYRCTKEAVRLMISHQYGRIVNVSSVGGLAGSAGQTNYAASKAALLGFMRSLAFEVSAHGIRVNCIVPGVIETDMMGTMPRERRMALIEGTALKRAGKAEEVAEAIVFLMSDGASYIQGASLVVDGGLVHS